jgi:hypothetical protein
MYIFYAPYVVCTVCCSRSSGANLGGYRCGQVCARVEEKGEKRRRINLTRARSLNRWISPWCCLILSAVPRPLITQSPSPPHPLQISYLPSPANESRLLKERNSRAESAAIILFRDGGDTIDSDLVRTRLGAETPESDSAGFLNANHVILAGLVRETILLVVVEEEIESSAVRKSYKIAS